ncbi:hypothetical protein AKJ09_09394 [Labilithrix luteola]|uniref:Uncharacterized protein n=1 Tax=Labilithrix luteola TaxID=1391654 RepID=A0A0K1QAD2_9BACT|nr:hypothetical protein [Labilithrix luteola]AKV02731.1 hypothetical protein AKJ09_09394 [Labilithrix luteola]
MAIAELTEHYVTAQQAAADQAGQVRVGVHDASRLEWSVSIPLPASGTVDYSLRVEIQIPQSAFVRHVPWDQMQAYTRLDGPAIAAHGDVVTIDALRRGALAMASQLARASDGFARHCRLAGSLFATAAHSELEDALTIWIEAALRIAQEARERMARPAETDKCELATERALVDEYISVRLLEALAGAERALSNLVESKSAHIARLSPVFAAVEDRLAEVLAAEVAYRAERGFGNADPSSPVALERYLERSSRLKKHFQEVLFLERETFHVAERAYHWIAGFVAVLASTWAFAWQLALSTRARPAETVSSGLITLALFAGLIYATKDRMKEIGRQWMTTRVHQFWGAQRITRYRAPARRIPGRDVIVSARESFGQCSTSLPDPLNPEAGATVPISVLTYEHKGTVESHRQLLASGVRRVKHVFRYDLSPMFARLDDALKPVPVLDGASRKVRFIDAPRCYRVPIKVEVCVGGERHEELATLVLHKRGLERLDREKDSNPSLAEIGIEPA